MFSVATAAAAATTIITMPHLVIAVKQQLHTHKSIARVCVCMSAFVCKMCTEYGAHGIHTQKHDDDDDDIEGK